MAAALRHGLQPAQFDQLRPGELRELLKRLDHAEMEEMKARMELEAKYVGAITDAVGALIKAQEGITKRLDAMHMTIAKKPTL